MVESNDSCWRLATTNELIRKQLAELGKWEFRAPVKRRAVARRCPRQHVTWHHYVIALTSSLVLQLQVGSTNTRRRCLHKRLKCLHVRTLDDISQHARYRRHNNSRGAVVGGLYSSSLVWVPLLLLIASANNVIIYWKLCIFAEYVLQNMGPGVVALK